MWPAGVREANILIPCLWRMLNAAGVTQSTEESRDPESRSRQQLPSSPGVLGKSWQSRPLLRYLFRTQPKGSQERKTEVPAKVASSQSHSGCDGPGTFTGHEEQSLSTFLQRDLNMSPLFHLHTLSLFPPCLSLPPEYPSQPPGYPLCPPIAFQGWQQQRQYAGCALWVAQSPAWTTRDIRYTSCFFAAF